MPAKTLAGAKVYIATPAHDGTFVTQYVSSYNNMIVRFQKLGIGWMLGILEKCSILPHARNLLAADFLASDCSHLLFIDSDMGWPDYAALELLAHDRDVVAAVGRMKDEEHKFCCHLDADRLLYDKEAGLIRVGSVGTGFMLVKKHVIEKLTEATKGKAYRKGNGAGKAAGDLISPIFDIEYRDGIMFGEDYTFCRRWQDLGGDVWVDPGIPLAHVGPYEYAGTYATALKAASANE